MLIGEIDISLANPTKNGAKNFPNCPMNSMSPREVDCIF